MFNVHFVFEDSSKLNWLVSADSERNAVNAVLNHTKTVKKPKFVIVEKPSIFASEEDLDLLSKFDSWGGDHSNVYNIENKLSEVIDIGGIKVCLGSLAEYADVVSILKEELK